MLERALTLCTEGVITAGTHHACAPATRPAHGAATQRRDRRRPTAGGAARSASQLEDIERDAIVKALEKTRYNKTAAAKLLGMSFRALRYRIKKLGIE